MSTTDSPPMPPAPASLQPPKSALLPVNRCNLPARIIASLAYQRAPAPLQLDGVVPLYQDLLQRLQQCTTSAQRLACFRNYMAVRFRLPVDDLPPSDLAEPQLRPRAHYGRLIRGWLFDADSREGAVWKGWVESRFGLVTRYHHEPIPGPDSAAHLRFLEERARGIHNTNALEVQLDLLYTFCQQELRQRFGHQTHLTLYRGSRGGLYADTDGQPVKLFNNLSSFTLDPEEAQRFGHQVMRVEVPLSKIVCFDSLLPGQLQGEQEYMVLGGLYRVTPWSGVPGQPLNSGGRNICCAPAALHARTVDIASANIEPFCTQLDPFFPMQKHRLGNSGAHVL